MQALQRLLLNPTRSCTGTMSAQRSASSKRRRIGRIGLVALDVGSHVARRQQPHPRRRARSTSAPSGVPEPQASITTKADLAIAETSARTARDSAGERSDDSPMLDQPTAEPQKTFFASLTATVVAFISASFRSVALTPTPHEASWHDARRKQIGRSPSHHSSGPAEENMDAPKHFEVMEGYCCYRLSGHGPLAEAAARSLRPSLFAGNKGCTIY